MSSPSHASLPVGRRTAYRHEYRHGLRFLVPLREDEVLINDNIRKCVAFIGDNAREPRPVATAFFVTHPIEGTDYHTLYAVTASHVVAGSAKLPPQTYLRVNQSDGQAAWLTTDTAEWVCHEDGRVDVAAIPIDWPGRDILERFDHLNSSTAVAERYPARAYSGREG